MMVLERFPGSLPPFIVPVVFGLTIMVMVYSVGHISGAHFNPAVTIAFAIVRHFPFKEVWAYCVAQITGAFLALFLLNLILPSGQIFGASIPHGSGFQTLIWEALLTFFLMFVIIAVATDTRAVGVMAGVAIGVTVMICAWVGGPVTGASMNPARALAPAFFQNQMGSFWIYLVGPVGGAVLGALFYEFIRCEKNENQNSKGCC